MILYENWLKLFKKSVLCKTHMKAEGEETSKSKEAKETQQPHQICSSLQDP